MSLEAGAENAGIDLPGIFSRIRRDQAAIRQAMRFAGPVEDPVRTPAVPVIFPPARVIATTVSLLPPMLSVPLPHGCVSVCPDVAALAAGLGIDGNFFPDIGEHP